MDNTLESTIGVMSIMDDSGHHELKWNRSDAKDIAAARKTFDGLIRKGYAAFGSDKRWAAKHGIKTFDPALEEVVMVPRIVGG